MSTHEPSRCGRSPRCLTTIHQPTVQPPYNPTVSPPPKGETPLEGYLRRQQIVIAEVLEVIKPHRPHATVTVIEWHSKQAMTSSILGLWMFEREQWYHYLEKPEERERIREPTHADLVALVLFGRYTDRTGQVSFHPEPLV